MYDIEQVKTIYDQLTQKVKEDLNDQFEKGRLKGTDYANVYAQLMDRCLQLAFQSPLNETQQNKINTDIEISQAQSEKDLLIKDKEIALKERQAELYERQRQGFDDNLKQKLLEIQLNAWSMMFSSGMLEAKPSIITNDEVSSLYRNIKNSL